MNWSLKWLEVLHMWPVSFCLPHGYIHRELGLTRKYNKACVQRGAEIVLEMEYSLNSWPSRSWFQGFLTPSVIPTLGFYEILLCPCNKPLPLCPFSFLLKLILVYFTCNIESWIFKLFNLISPSALLPHSLIPSSIIKTCYIKFQMVSETFLSVLWH